MNIVSLLNRLIPWLIFAVLPISMTNYFGEKYSIVKWTIVFFIFFLEAVNFLSCKTYVWIKDRYFSIFLGIILVGAILSLLKNFNPVTIMGSLEFLIFWIFFFIFLNKEQFEKTKLLKNEMPIYAGLGCALIYATYQFFESASGGNFSVSHYNSFFGNNNMASEYILLTLPIQFMFFNDEKKAANNWIKAITLSASIFFLLMWYSRSTWVSLAAVISLFFILRLFTKKIFLSVLFAFAISLTGKFYLVSSAETSEITTSKKVSAGIRKNLLTTGLAMAVDNPFGLGSSQFLFNSLAYQKFTDSPNEEGTLYKSPHNEVLKLTVEYGWITLIGAVLLFLYLLRQLYLIRHDKNNLFVFGSYFSIFLMSILFQFPSENAFPFIFLAMVLAHFIYLTNKSVWVFNIKNSWFKFIKISIVGFSFLMFTFFSLSYFLEFNYSRSPDYSSIACTIYPSNWRGCLNKVQIDIFSHNLNSARTGVTKELAQRPFNYVALKLLTITNFESGNFKQACGAGWLYDELFNWKSSWHSYLNEKCPAPEMKNWANANEYHEYYLQRLESLITF